MEKRLPTKSELLLAVQWSAVFINDCHFGVYNRGCIERLYAFLESIADPVSGYNQFIKDYLQFVELSCDSEDYSQAARDMNLITWELSTLATID